MGSNHVLGIDIGTTTICGVVIDINTGKVLESRTVPNDTAIIASHKFEKVQDPTKIFDIVNRLIPELINGLSPLAIGITGQMHGILYVNCLGEAVSPLYTWQDERGNCKMENSMKSYAEYLSVKTGYHMPTGYGLTTHYYNCCNDLVPENAAYLCTIGDYITMKLTATTVPKMSPSNAASLGCYSMEQDAFDAEALKSVGIDWRILPEILKDVEIIGTTSQGIPVSVSIGDNQASFIGSVKDMEHTVLVNVGTGSQVSIGVETKEKQIIIGSELEIRPCMANKYIYAGSSLCGGSAYALLERFFREVVTMAIGYEPDSLYNQMELELEKVIQEPMIFDTKFRGTRSDPEIRGSITNIGINNFTPSHMIQATLNGIAGELFDMYQKACSLNNEEAIYLVGSGNGIRKNLELQHILQSMFQMELRIPVHKEEASYGAALYSLVGCGYYQSIEKAQEIISYL